MLSLLGDQIFSDSVAVAPGMTFAIGPGTGTAHFARCEFDFNGGRTALRALIQVSDGTSGIPQANLPAE